MNKIQLALIVSLVALTILASSQNKTIEKLEATIANQNETNMVHTESNKDVTFTESIKIKFLEDELKTKNKIIKMDNVIFTKHERELELYGDFFVAVLRGIDREERLLRKDTLEAGAKMTEIKKEIKELIKARKELNI